ncbi:MAG TPA: pseudouridine synthase [Solirubrobacteraceae bacterium]|nr:pseudouridine synthase [Solirubrobacteraceae bacterium]
MRLAKYLAHAGLASRRRAEEIIAEGRVSVDGETVRDPARDVDERRDVRVDGRRLVPPPDREVFMLHKPAGVVSTARDTHGRPTVVDIVPARRRLYPVGRLDADTTGLILLTDDGELAHRLTHPSFEVDKTYLATVAGAPVREVALRRLRDGVELEDGRTAPARVDRVRPDTLAITIHEGRKRQVRRMCAAVGHPVLALCRVRLGPLELGELAEGAVRALTPEEIAALSRAGAGGRHGPGSSRSVPRRPSRPARPGDGAGPAPPR